MRLFKIEFTILAFVLIIGSVIQCKATKSSEEMLPKGKDVSVSVPVEDQDELKSIKMTEDCFSSRKKIDTITKEEGKIVRSGDFFYIASLSGRRYTPCKMPESYCKEGLNVVFSGEVLADDPRERRMGSAFHLHYISAKKI